MEQILNQLLKIQERVSSLKKNCKENNFSVSFLNGFNLKRMREIYTRLQKHYEQNPLRGKTLWFQCELKLFKWVLICYSCLKDKKIQNFENQDWEFFRRIFLGKDLYTFKFESKRLMTKTCQNLRNWNSEEDQLLTTIMKDSTMMNKWSEVARIFYQRSGQKFFRTSKQCRQHWMNHLDPSKEHGKWNFQEDLIILKCVISNGKKWSIISKNQLPHRTEHMIKNRFKSIFNRYRKTQHYTSSQQKVYLKNIVKELTKNQKDQKLSEIKIKQEEPSISQNISQVQACSVEQKIKEEDGYYRNVVFSKVQKTEEKMISKGVIMEYEKCPSINACSTPNYSPMYSNNQLMFGMIYQPSLICLLFTCYENYWAANMNGF